MSSESLHEPAEKLSPATIDRHRATVSLIEELEAVDWYDQRIDGATDEALKEVLRHNRDEEKEHAAMVLEWIRRRDPKFDEHLRTYLFSSGDILMIEDKASASDRSPEAAPASPPPAGMPVESREEDGRPTLTVGSLRPGRK